MNPYESNPDNIPATDPYADVPYYGRYLPRPDDFQVDPQYIRSQSPDALRYWSSVLSRCTETLRIYPADENGRDVFALGSVIVKSSHLHEDKDGGVATVDYSYADANEIEATTLCRDVIYPVKVPRIYFSGKINGRQVLVQERIPGVALTVAYPYLSERQKASFKQQAREILRKLHTVKPDSPQKGHRHIVPDPNIIHNGRINELEKEVLFSHAGAEEDPDASLMHNDFTPSNCIVDEGDRITGLVDWEMAGFFGWKKAGKIHQRIRTPQKEHYVNANLTEEQWRDIAWWNDLYDEGVHA